ncbi:hypothetical protein [Candidatus Leptofilum sp.]|uniref:hypothetical protein n=1 Tax=Candidatus Leptofilum sp. TaxID=3241576 RepID=UPI003B5AE12B
MKIETDGAYGEPHIVCPYCDFEYVHPAKVRVYPVEGDLEWEITSKGPALRDSDAAKHQRGVTISITFFCESGHSWESVFQFHKGSTFFNVIEVKSDNDLDTLWRD